MIRHKEFWLGLFLLMLVVFYCFLLKTVNDIGQYWVNFLHPYAQAKGVSDKMIYVSKTRESFILIGSSLGVFLVGLSVEVVLLLKRIQIQRKSRLPEVVFCLTVTPVVFAIGRALVNLYKIGRLF